MPESVDDRHNDGEKENGKNVSLRNWVEDDLAVLVMDHLAPRPGRDARFRERAEGMLVDVVAARSVFTGERLKGLNRVEDVAEVGANGYPEDAICGFTDESAAVAVPLFA
jgi:hypothetical protein